MMGHRLTVVLVSAAVLSSGCSEGSQSSPAASSFTSSAASPSAPGMDTLRAALSERDPLERNYLLTSFLRALRVEDVPEMLAEVEKHRVGIDAEEVNLLMLAWTRIDGSGAFTTAKNWPTPWKTILMKGAMYAWGFNDGRAALAELRLIEDEELREALEVELLAGWVSSDNRLAASEFAATVPIARRRNRLALRLAAEAGRDGHEAVIAWAEAIPEDAPNDFKMTAFEHAAGSLARLDPKRAAPWYERHMQHAYSRGGLRNLATKWAHHHDPEPLVVWIESLPVEESREGERKNALRAAFRAWVKQAPEEVEAWLGSAAAGPTRDSAIDEFTRALAKVSPAEALRWSGQITDEELRRMRTLRYTRQWFTKDPEAAQAWLAEAQVPERWREQILNNLPHAQRQGSAKTAEQDG
jgi:hypothetical protein